MVVCHWIPLCNVVLLQQMNKIELASYKSSFLHWNQYFILRCLLWLYYKRWCCQPKDVQSQRLHVHCHSAGLQKENEETRLGLESMVKIIDPSPLPIPDWQSKMLPGWVWGFKNYLKCWGKRMPCNGNEPKSVLWAHFTPRGWRVWEFLGLAALSTFRYVHL